MRKVGYLLEEVRLHGQDPELRDEVIQLSKEHGIMTPYTSFLVLRTTSNTPSTTSRELAGKRHRQRKPCRRIDQRIARHYNKQCSNDRSGQRYGQ